MDPSIVAAKYRSEPRVLVCGKEFAAFRVLSKGDSSLHGMGGRAMGIDFEKQVRDMQQGRQPTLPAENPGSSTPFPHPEPEDPAAVHFPLRVLMLGAYVIAIAGLVVWIVYSAVTGALEFSLMPVYAGGAGILALMGLLPMSLTLDSRGIHQSHFLGLWERTIPWNDVRFYWRTTREELRLAGLLAFQSRNLRHQKHDHEEVVYVGSKSSKRYLLHTAVHRERERFILELERRGAHPKGYEEWESFMESRGVPVS
ncbi:MAG: hypothetical protein KIT83_18760 [Bryobacterales bacterium]|nr:hypothetical protein [Bryobacterales bacterium]